MHLIPASGKTDNRCRIQMRLIPALSIGSRALPHCVAGSVHSVYRQACNVELNDGALVTLLGAEPGNLPHGIRCLLPEPEDFQVWLRPGQAVAGDGLLLRIPEAAVAIDLSGAAHWRCGLDGCAIDPDAEASVRALRAARLVLQQQAPQGGFAPLLLQDVVPDSPLERVMQKRLRQTLPALGRAGSSFDCGAAAQALERLTGLGPGLTPSGDDFIVGYLAALYARRSREPMLRPYLAGLIAPLTRLAAAANAISRQFMLNALAGEFSESLAQVALAIAARDELLLQQSTARLVRVGHSSGADSLAGLLFGLRPSLLVPDAPAPRLATV
jgi:hypothetical protein